MYSYYWYITFYKYIKIKIKILNLKEFTSGILGLVKIHILFDLFM